MARPRRTRPVVASFPGWVGGFVTYYVTIARSPARVPPIFVTYYVTMGLSLSRGRLSGFITYYVTMDRSAARVPAKLRPPRSPTSGRPRGRRTEQGGRRPATPRHPTGSRRSSRTRGTCQLLVDMFLQNLGRADRRCQPGGATLSWGQRNAPRSATRRAGARRDERSQIPLRSRAASI